LLGLLIEYLFGLNFRAVHGSCVCVDVGEWKRVRVVGATGIVNDCVDVGVGRVIKC
jgi:hypothetical protein